MERNKWETAIRCLEIALHPNTGDDEVIAAVNGFRRTADGRRLRDICAAVADAPSALAPPPANDPNGFSRENRELRRRLAGAERALEGAAAELRDAAADIARLRVELRATREAAAAAEGRFSEVQLAQAQFVDRLKRDNAELRRALEGARPAPPSFGTALASALGRGEPRPPAAVERARGPLANRHAAGAAWVA